jgi:phage gpG-like protein
VTDELRVEVYGLDELVRGSRKLVEEIDEEADDRFEDVADKVGSSARSRVPRRSGALAASVTSGERRGRAFVSIGGYDVPYAGWIEFGGARRGRGGGVASRPYIGRGRYLYPVAINAEPMLVAAGDDAARKEIKEARWPRPTRW